MLFKSSPVNSGAIFGGEAPADSAKHIEDMGRPLDADDRRRHAGMVRGPVEGELRERFTRGVRDFTEALNDTQVASETLAREIRVARPYA